MNQLEKDLIEKSQQGDIESFELLIKQYQQWAFNIAYRMLGNMEDAKDASQDAFIKIFKSLHTFKGDSSFSTWIYKVVANTCLDELRKRKKQQTYSYNNPIKTEEGKVERNLPDMKNLPEDVIQRKEIQKEVHQAINLLSEQHKTVIILRDIKGLSYGQISEILDCPEGTIKSRISRARIALKNVLKGKKELYNNDCVKI